MIRLKEATRAWLMIMHGVAMVALGLELFYIRAAMTNRFYVVFGFALAMLLVAASLLFIAVLDWICAAGLGSQQASKLRWLLIVSTVAAASSVFLLLDARSTVRLLCYFLALYSLLLGIGKAFLARYWKGTPGDQVGMYVLAGLSIAFSALLVLVAGQDERTALAVVAGYSLFVGLLMLFSTYYLQQQMAKTIAPLP
jgi:hypothetical protein